MRILFYWYEHHTDQLILNALGQSIRSHGDTVTVLPKSSFHPDQLAGVDAVFTRGIAESRPIMNSCMERGVHVVYCDKGYFGRGWNDENAYYRLSVNSFHPLHYFQAVPRPPDRWKRLGIALKPRQKTGQAVVFASIPSKSAAWCGFDSEEYANRIIAKIKALTGKAIVYRPRKTKNPPPPIPGTIYSHGRCDIWEELENAHALVTYSSNAAADAILAGVPAFVLGPGIARPVANTDLSALNAPTFPSEKERLQWCYDVAYCQWSIEEMREAAIWQELKEKMRRPEFKVSYAERDFV